MSVYDNFELLMDEVLKEKNVNWHPVVSQISLNTVPGYENDFHKGTGSLLYKWTKSSIVQDENGLEKIELEKNETPLSESDFTVLCSQFVGTVFEEIYNDLNKHYVLGRVRLMKSNPKTCLTWHVDPSPRIHYPIKTQEGCFMVIEDEVKHLEENKWYWTNTVVKHTAFNASSEYRIHLVAAILGEK